MTIIKCQWWISYSCECLSRPILHLGCVFRGSTERLASKLHTEASGIGDKQLQRHYHTGPDYRHREMTCRKLRVLLPHLSSSLIINTQVLTFVLISLYDFGSRIGLLWKLWWSLWVCVCWFCWLWCVCGGYFSPSADPETTSKTLKWNTDSQMCATLIHDPLKNN